MEASTNLTKLFSSRENRFEDCFCLGLWGKIKRRKMRGEEKVEGKNENKSK
jgi:hypothetical protein